MNFKSIICTLLISTFFSSTIFSQVPKDTYENISIDIKRLGDYVIIPSNIHLIPEVDYSSKVRPTSFVANKLLDMQKRKVTGVLPGIHGRAFWEPKFYLHNDRIAIPSFREYIIYNSEGKYLFNLPYYDPKLKVHYVLNKTFDKVAYVFERDLYIKDFDRNSGILSNPKQITFLGTLGHHSLPDIWDGDGILFGRNRLYINIKTGKVITTPFVLNQESYIEGYFTYSKSNPNGSEVVYSTRIKETNQYITSVLDINSGDIKLIKPGQSQINSFGNDFIIYTPNTIDNKEKKSYYVKDGILKKELDFYAYLPIQSLGLTTYDFAMHRVNEKESLGVNYYTDGLSWGTNNKVGIYDIFSGKVEPIPGKYVPNHMGFVTNDLIHFSISKPYDINDFIVDEQGSFLYNIKDKSVVKIFGYVSSESYNFMSHRAASTPEFLLEANKHVWLVNFETNDKFRISSEQTNSPLGGLIKYKSF